MTREINTYVVIQQTANNKQQKENNNSERTITSKKGHGNLPKIRIYIFVSRWNAYNKDVMKVLATSQIPLICIPMLYGINRVRKHPASGGGTISSLHALSVVLFQFNTVLYHIPFKKIFFQIFIFLLFWIIFVVFGIYFDLLKLCAFTWNLTCLTRFFASNVFSCVKRYVKIHVNYFVSFK